MSVAQNQGNRTGFLSPGNPLYKQWHISDALLPISLVMWAVGVARTDTKVLGPYGLLSVLPPVFYAAIALLIVSVAIELTRQQLSHWRMSVHAAALVVMLYATAPIVYSQGRYSWLYKTVGVVQYMGAHGSVNQQIDIYQSWPGFFAFAAWFDKVAGVSSPLAYAKWAQLVVELGSELGSPRLLFTAGPSDDSQPGHHGDGNEMDVCGQLVGPVCVRQASCRR